MHFFLKSILQKQPLKMFMTGVLCTVCGAQVYFSWKLSQNVTNQTKSTVKIGYMCPRGLTGPPAVTLTK